MSGVYYNEFDPFAAAWLRELIKDGLIAPGDVDERSITDVDPADLVGYTQCHFFAGIGGWSAALLLAGWDDDRPAWTGSCPCQPFSSAGKGAGASDARHLWPAFHRLIAERRPPVVLGEQVASGLGRLWLTAVRADLEALGYAVGATDLCAAGVGAFHIRQRLWWVADSRLADAEGAERAGLGAKSDGEQGGPATAGGLGDADGGRCGQDDGQPAECAPADAGQAADWGGGRSDAHPWSAVEWLPCRDGKTRPTQPGLFPLAHGVPNRVGALRGAGNAIVPQVAAAFVSAYMDTIDARVTEA